MPFKKGNKEGSKSNKNGEKPNWFKSWSHELLSDERTLNRIKKIFFKKGDDRIFWEMARYFHELNHGKPVQQIDASFNVNLGTLLGDLPRDKTDTVETTADVQALENGDDEAISNTLDSQDVEKGEHGEDLSVERGKESDEVGAKKKQNKAQLSDEDLR